jgi:hypothetical protein
MQGASPAENAQANDFGNYLSARVAPCTPVLAQAETLAARTSAAARWAMRNECSYMFG